jgi:hypothetical protein
MSMAETSTIMQSQLNPLFSVLTCPHCGKFSEEIIPPDM